MTPADAIVIILAFLGVLVLAGIGAEAWALWDQHQDARRRNGR